MISSVISSGLSLMETTSFSLTDFLAVLLNPVAFITAVFYSISLLINGLIYSLAAYMYALFPAMCELDFSALTPQLQNIISRIEVFIGIFMLFIVAFNLLQYMVDPDKKEGATSKLITKIIVALILLVSSSFIFGILDELQTALVSRTKDNIAQTVLFGKTDETSGSDIETGRRIVYAVFFNMYENQAYGDKYGYDKEYNDLVSGESFWILIGHLWQTPETYARVYFHYPLLSEVFGLFLLILFATFTIDIGVRNITLLFLRMLFPIAAIGYITPKGDNILSGYISTYMSTYVQVFVKTFIIYLLLYIFLWFMEALTTIDGALFKNSNLDDTSKTILLLLIVVALFMFFSKGLPAIMKKVFGVEMESSLGGMFGKALGIAAAGASLAAGGLFGGLMGGAKAGAKGALKGALAGAKGGASAGWNAGKQVGSGNIGAAVTGYGKGMYAAYGGVKNASTEAAKPKEQALQDAKNAEKDYEAKNMAANRAEELAAAYAADDNSAEARVARIRALHAREDANNAYASAVDKAQKARKIDKDYTPNNSNVREAVTQAEVEAREARADARQQREVDRVGGWFDEANAGESGGASTGTGTPVEVNATSGSGSSGSGSAETTVEANATSGSGSVVNGNTGAPVEVNATSGSGSVVNGSTGASVEVNATSGSGSVVNGSTGASVEVNATPGSGSDRNVSTGTSARADTPQERAATGTGDTSGQQREEANKEQMDEINERNRNNNIKNTRGVMGSSLPGDEGEPNEETPVVDSIEVPVTEEVVEETTIEVEQPEDTNDDSGESGTPKNIDAELEDEMNKDHRSYGQRSSDRFRELVDGQRMDAVLAMRMANQEAHDRILEIARGLVSEGYNAHDAYIEARRRYNEGE